MYQTIGAVIAGNVLFAMMAYFWWRASQNEKNGLKPFDNLSFGVALCGAIPPLIVAAGAYFTV
jgi:heme/copper-type cytochrome/quinol oxidase subunit 2